MAWTNLDPAAVTIASPTINAPNLFFYGVAALPEFQGLTVSAGSDSTTQLSGILNVSLIPTGIIGAVDSINIYMQTTASSTSADTWELHAGFASKVARFPLTSPDNTSYMVNTVLAGNGTKLYGRTHPASTAKVESILNATHAGGAALAAGGGTISGNGAAQQQITSPQYLWLELQADANDDITIDTLMVWGTFREV